MATAKEIVKKYGLDVREVAKESGFAESAIHLWAKTKPKRVELLAAGIYLLRKNKG